MMRSAYIDTVKLLLDIAPEVFKSELFALKGGTAINLFLRDTPRLSVDLDLVHVDHETPREESLHLIQGALNQVADQLGARGMQCVKRTVAEETKLFIERDRVQVKIEANHVYRGTLLPVVSRPLCEKAQNLFFTDIELPLLQPDEIYGSKLVAAMDRQHPRDIFDVMGMYGMMGLTPGIVECFVSCLAGHNRPVHEVLFANQLDLTQAYKNEFVGMTEDPVSLDLLLETRARLFDELPQALTDSQRQFLISLVKAEPDWTLMSCPHLEQLPAIRWKLANLERLKKSNPAKFAAQHHELNERFGG